MAIGKRIPATLVFEDGTVFRGWSFGATGEVVAEIIFNTGMTGYQEVITDPSYCGQMVVLTYPLIGNYGINTLDRESDIPQLAALIVKELSGITSNWQSEEDLDSYLKRYNVPGIQGIDTRAAVLHLRTKGAMKAVLSTETQDVESLLLKAKGETSFDEKNSVYNVSTKDAYEYKLPEQLQELNKAIGARNEFAPEQSEKRYKVVAYDFGAKRNIFNLLTEQNIDLHVVPAKTSAEDVLALNPDGIFLSNGPGDPADLHEPVENIKKLLGKKPIFGICLGHQLLGLANGAKTFKLKFGHHGSNHPVKDLLTNKVEITSQNHNYCVDMDTLPSSAKVTHINLNDNTVEGFQDEDLKYFCVQYHPEACPGPHDSAYLFRRFRDWITKYQ